MCVYESIYLICTQLIKLVHIALEIKKKKIGNLILIALYRLDSQ